MTAALLLILKETFMALIARIAWKAIAERFFTRLVISGLNKLAKYSTNNVTTETVNDIISNLQGKQLLVANEYKTKRIT